MNYIFLDVDGVLNNVGQVVSEISTCPMMDENGFDETSVRLLDWLCKVTNAKIVFSSSWRTIRTWDWFNEVLHQYDTEFTNVIASTPYLPGLQRGDEVKEYVDKHLTPNDSYVIFDDSIDFHEDQPLIKVDDIVGLTLYNVVEAAEILGVLEKHQNDFNQIKQIVEFKRK